MRSKWTPRGSSHELRIDACRSVTRSVWRAGPEAPGYLVPCGAQRAAVLQPTA